MSRLKVLVDRHTITRASQEIDEAGAQQRVHDDRPEVLRGHDSEQQRPPDDCKREQLNNQIPGQHRPEVVPAIARACQLMTPRPMRIAPGLELAPRWGASRRCASARTTRVQQRAAPLQRGTREPRKQPETVSLVPPVQLVSM